MLTFSEPQPRRSRHLKRARHPFHHLHLAAAEAFRWLREPISVRLTLGVVVASVRTTSECDSVLWPQHLRLELLLTLGFVARDLLSQFGVKSLSRCQVHLGNEWQEVPFAQP